MFEEVDVDRDGSISFDEFVELVAAVVAEQEENAASVASGLRSSNSDSLCALKLNCIFR